MWGIVVKYWGIVICVGGVVFIVVDVFFVFLVCGVMYFGCVVLGIDIVLFYDCGFFGGGLKLLCLEVLFDV